MEKKTIKVNGMSCNHCAGAVQNALGGINGVKDAVVNLKAGTVSFNIDSALASMETVAAAIAEAGFEAAGEANG